MEETNNSFITDERYAELRERMSKKLYEQEMFEPEEQSVYITDDNIKKYAFDAIYHQGCDEVSTWIQTLIECYPEEVVDILGNNPYEVYHELTDWWEYKEYEDPRTGICLTYNKWAEFFISESAHYIYEELIKAKMAGI